MKKNAHMLSTMRTVMGVLGYRSSDLEKKLGWRSGYVSRLLNGAITLRFEHVLDIAGALEMRPEELFEIAYVSTDQPPSSSVQQFYESTGHTPRRPIAAGHFVLSEEQLRLLLNQTLRRMFRTFAELLEESLPEDDLAELPQGGKTENGNRT